MKKNAAFTFIGLIVIAGILSLLILRPQSGSMRTAGYFTASTMPLKTYNLYDLGAAIVNNDMFLDVFTVNHSASQSLLAGNGNGKFTDIFSVSGLDQDHQYPGLEDSDVSPDMTTSGLYIYRRDRWLNIRAHNTEDTGPISGILQVPWPLVVKSIGKGTRYENTTTPHLNGVMSTVSFSLSSGGRLKINGHDDIVELPHAFQFEENVPLDQIHLGAMALAPENRDFSLMWRDRHSMSWIDYDADDNLDVFIGRGGVKGRLDIVSTPIVDEFLISQSGIFEDRINDFGIEKGNCPARQTAWVDFDSDGDLDLYVSCGRENIENPYPNRLYRRDKSGRFDEVAAQFGLDYDHISVFTWLDSDNDNDMDLLSIEGQILKHYVNEDGQFIPTIVATNLVSKFVKTTVADYDKDGDLDAFLLSRTQSILLSNNSGSFSILDTGTVGLPSGGRTANWTDFDNDGLIDLHVVPSGLYRQSPDHHFDKTSILEESTPPQRVSDARCTWFDVDGNGARDVVCAVEKYPVRLVRIARKLFDRSIDTRFWQSFIYLNQETDNHWLQIELIGFPENRQAIGARAYVDTDSGKQMQQVGMAEGSHYSQGHYRLYFGLGSNSDIKSVTIVWPNGKIQKITDVESDRLLVVKVEQ